MSIQQQIEQKLVAALHPHYMQVINESSQHNVAKGSETHFKLIVVSTEFASRKLLERQRTIYQLLADELSKHIHALSMYCYTPEEWQSAGHTVADSPKCRGGSGK